MRHGKRGTRCVKSKPTLTQQTRSAWLMRVEGETLLEKVCLKLDIKKAKFKSNAHGNTVMLHR